MFVTALYPSPAVHDPVGTVIDRAHLAQYTLGDPELEAEILGLFVESLAPLLADVGRMAGVIADETPHQGDDVWRRVLHTIKGSARGVGASALGDAAAAAEQCAPRERDGAISPVSDVLREGARVLAALDPAR